MHAQRNGRFIEIHGGGQITTLSLAAATRLANQITIAVIEANDPTAEG